MVVTILIVGILAAVASPRFFGSLNQFQVEQAVLRVQADLKLARQKAIAKSTAITVTFDPATSSYSISGIDSIDRPGQPYSVDLSGYPYHCELVSASFGGDDAFQFSRYGQPDSGDTITVQAGQIQKTVVVDPDSGKATLP